MNAHSAKVIINIMFDDNMNENVKQALAVVNDALDKQIPKKPHKFESDIVTFAARCSLCGGIVVDGSFKNPFCRECGQLIDWGEEE